MPKSPTVEDVARVAGVSRQTVSNVLNTPDDRQARRPASGWRPRSSQLGYRPHSAARMLRTQRSSTIGIHLDPYSGGISGVVLDRFVHALTERAGERGMRVLIYSARSADEEIERLGEPDRRRPRSTRSSSPARSTATRARAGCSSATCRSSRSAGRGAARTSYRSTHTWVDVDGAAGTRAATRHALATAGPRVGFVGWPSDAGTGDDRERGWREAMADAGATGPRFETVDGLGAARTAMTRRVRRRSACCAISTPSCASSDALAVGTHLAAADAGRRELPVIGFDNTPVAEALGISSVEQSPELVARAVLDLLMGPTGHAVTAHDSGLAPAARAGGAPAHRAGVATRERRIHAARIYPLAGLAPRIRRPSSLRQRREERGEGRGIPPARRPVGDRDRRDRPADVVEHRDADRAESERHLAVLERVAAGAHLAQHLAQLAGPRGTSAGAIGEGRGIRDTARAPARGGARRASTGRWR